MVMAHSSSANSIAAALVFAVAPLTLTVDRGIPRSESVVGPSAAEIVIHATSQQAGRPTHAGMRCPPFSAHHQARICGRFRVS